MAAATMNIQEEAKEIDPLIVVRRRIWFAFFVFVIGVLIASVYVWRWLEQPITQIKVFGEVKHFEPQSLVQAWLPSQPKLLSVSIEELHSSVSAQPWVAKAAVVKNWPSTLDVYVVEEQPIARWRDSGLLNADAQVFWPDSQTQGLMLPHLMGPDGTEEQVVAQYLDINALLRRYQLALIELTFDPRGSWHFVLENGMQVRLGKEDIADRLNRFLAIYEQALKQQSDKIAAVHLRYTNGVAVEWHSAANEDRRGR